MPDAKRRHIYAGPEHALCSHTSGGWARQGILDAPPPPERRAQPKAAALKFFDTRHESDGGTA
ncbi:hypothetical protein FHR72_001735 [Mycolicibacterium iranicum]|uniref:Uncharacterized protein n=1 Tax=Mycolicibacterium iranicum TaxID=912594 RepID=A0A839Q3K3_MYCIR|nr:hypothetical protein [Mycolicibacterium iranicum]MBB2990267.1 hypothetical protein [Mycolicibacterium iranicum]